MEAKRKMRDRVNMFNGIKYHKQKIKEIKNKYPESFESKVSYYGGIFSYFIIISWIAFIIFICLDYFFKWNLIK